MLRWRRYTRRSDRRPPERPEVEFDQLELRENERRFIWYQTVWSLAALYANRLEANRYEGDEEEQRTRREHDRLAARRYAVVLAQTAANTLQKTDLSRGFFAKPLALRPRTRRLCAFLHGTIEPSAATLVAGLSVGAEAPPRPAPGSRPHRRFIELLERAAENDSGGAAARELVARFVLPWTWPARTHYTIACYLASAGETTGAIDQLRLAFDPKGAYPAELYLLADWAWNDPSLQTLREVPDFSAITSPYRGSREVDGLARAMEEEAAKKS